jgi:hypothetical protein
MHYNSLVGMAAALLPACHAAVISSADIQVNKRAYSALPDYWTELSLDPPTNNEFGVNRLQVTVCQANGEGSTICIPWDTLRHAAADLGSMVYGQSRADDCGTKSGAAGDGDRVRYIYHAEGACSTSAELATIEGAIKHHFDLQQNRQLCGTVCFHLTHGGT